jgi:hypothetical protein
VVFCDDDLFSPSTTAGFAGGSAGKSRDWLNVRVEKIDKPNHSNNAYLKGD